MAEVTKPALPVVSDLSADTAKVKREYGEIKKAMKDVVQKAMNLGAFFKQKKDEIPYGRFLKWVKQDCEMSYKTVERYMELAANRQHLDHLSLDTMSNLTINGALRLIAKATKGGGKAEDDEATKAAKAGNRYDKAEETLLDRLSKLKPEVADTAATQTVNALQAALAEIKKKLPPKLVEQPKAA
jgi:hypothetical protein